MTDLFSDYPTPSDNERPMEVSEDQREVVLRSIRNVQMALSMVGQSLEKTGTLLESQFRTCTDFTGIQLVHMARTLKVETDAVRDNEARVAKLRAANLRIRDLETKLGETQTPEALRHTMANMERQLRGWWDLEGFGHISEVRFASWGAEVKFCGMLFGAFSRLTSETPVSDRERRVQWHASLEAQGFVLVGRAHSREVSLLDCDQNRGLLDAMFAQRMPSAVVSRYENRRDDGHLVLTEINVLIRDLSDILKLPVQDSQD